MKISRLLLLVAFVACAGCGEIGWACGFHDNALQVARKEFYPDALLAKYEWFKDAAAALDKKQADIGVYDAKLAALAAAYRGLSRRDWPRDDREQQAIWASEVAGIKASYNQLASEYNAEMVKFNWRFTNVGDLPAGGRPLPREFRPYEEK